MPHVSIGNFTSKWSSKKSKSLGNYGFNAAGVVRYVGITERAAEVRFAEHLGATGTGRELLRYEVIQGATGLSRDAAKIMEQNLINTYGLGRNGGLLLNRINSIASKYWEALGIKP